MNEIKEPSSAGAARTPGKKKSDKKKRPRRVLTKHPFGLLPSGNAFFLSAVVPREPSLGSLADLDDGSLLVFLSTLAEFLPLSSLLSLSCVSKFMLAALLDEELWQTLLLTRFHGGRGAHLPGASAGYACVVSGGPSARENGETGKPETCGDDGETAGSSKGGENAATTPGAEGGASSFSSAEKQDTKPDGAASAACEWKWRGTWKRSYICAERQRLRGLSPTGASSLSSSASSPSLPSERATGACNAEENSIETSQREEKALLPVLQGVCSDTLYQRWLCATVDVSSLYYKDRDTLERVSAKELSVEDFVERYEKPNKPVVVTDLVPQWKAFGKWNEAYFRRHFSRVRFNAGAASDLPLETFYDYAHANIDEAPLFIFDPNFGESTRVAISSSSSTSLVPSSVSSVSPGSSDAERPAQGNRAEGAMKETMPPSHNAREDVRSLAEDYEVPPYFADDRDLFACLGKRRPNFRKVPRSSFVCFLWLLVGNARSGSKWHVDPNQTSAWNAVVKGRKRWIFLPPDTPPPGVFPSADGGEVTQPVSLVEWMMNYYFDALHAPGFPYTGGVAPIEGSVSAGELVFVPQGWWHCVLNEEDDTIAVTQNFVSATFLQNVRTFLHHKTDQISGAEASACDGAQDEKKRKEEEGDGGGSFWKRLKKKSRTVVVGREAA
ncbi:histone lysine demethylase JMJD6b [Besnoitia besnoiti]|uniref:Histone lysine demethylase JMJD6b n=1 Tax=Besnoitia besnoiti TaxID=94643 RepID=A0A2A9M4J9_BESBE|nr:histone lysine demethylase JMJD6b [Besnoitia besnoiti]PFH33408.1 histone lysine demethylase JMJD6b [Besnoitia besnoiti]